MGVNTHVFLHHSADLEDVAWTLGALAGTRGIDRHFMDLKHHGAAGTWGADQVRIVATHSPTYLKVEFSSPADAEYDRHYANVHLGPAYRGGEYGDTRFYTVSVRSTAFWIAVAKKLVDVFGGVVDFNDCDEKDNDYVVPEQQCMAAVDGNPWRERQARLDAVTPVTPEDIAAALPYSAYGV